MASAAGLGRLRRRNIDDDRGAGIDAVAGIADRAAVDRDRAGLDQRLEPGARQFGDMGGEPRSSRAPALPAGEMLIDFCVDFIECLFRYPDGDKWLPPSGRSRATGDWDENRRTRGWRRPGGPTPELDAARHGRARALADDHIGPDHALASPLWWA